jgi:hypothetical protein
MEKEKRKKLAQLRRNPVKFSSKSLLIRVSAWMGAFWEARRLQWSHEMHVTTFLSINDGLTNRVPILRDFETLGGYIVNF